MGSAKLCQVLGYIRRIAATSESKVTDSELLDEFASHRDEAAFAALVKRHGPMVMGVCGHVLHHEQDAEDAFQATFLVLARKAASIRKKAALVSWLHGVAYRTAMSAKKMAGRRRTYEARVTTMAERDSFSELAWREAQRGLDAEVQRLAEKYRAPFLLCYLKGQ